jgi:predicted AAA+ superfamily ATPase
MERLVARYLFDPEMTADKMIFLTGPRQVGKTTFARNWLYSAGCSDTYFNWDDPAVLAEYRRNPLFFKNIVEERYKGEPVPVVFDEIHKQKNWRDILKGFYDSNREKIRLLVTGSSHLGMYRKSGDSLVGRYFSYRMFPLGLPEAAADFSFVLDDDLLIENGDGLLREARKVNTDKTREALDGLIRFGGFPEPFLKASPKFHRRWQTDYKALLTKEDVRDLSRIADINKPLALFEAKESGREIAPAIRHFGRMLKIPCYQIVRDLERAEAFPDDCFLLPAASFLMLAG